MIQFLHLLLGFDKNILKKNEGGSTSLSVLIFSYLIILIFSIYGCYYAGYLLLDNIFLAILLSIFLTYILHNMYRLIIATSYEGKNLERKREVLKYSSLKGFLVVILSIFISSSLCVNFFDSEIEVKLEKYKSNLVLNYENMLNRIYFSQINDLNKSYLDEKEFNLLLDKKNNISDSLALKEKINEIEQLKKNKIETLKSSIVVSNFFIRKIIIISKHPKFWFLSICLVLFYLFPLYIFTRFKYFINYQELIEENNKKLILEEYNSFKNIYVNLLSSTAGKEITIHEKYEDPPFNTITKKRKEKILKKGSLLEWLKKYHG